MYSISKDLGESSILGQCQMSLQIALTIPKICREDRKTTKHFASSVTIDTACSSSLYALHSAVTALSAGDCDAAIVAAANLILSPEQYLGVAQAGVLSPTSTCHTFDISADGYGRGEAINALYIKRLSGALKDGDKIWAVIRGTAVNACVFLSY